MTLELDQYDRPAAQRSFTLKQLHGLLALPAGERIVNVWSQSDPPMVRLLVECDEFDPVKIGDGIEPPFVAGGLVRRFITLDDEAVSAIRRGLELCADEHVSPKCDEILKLADALDELERPVNVERQAERSAMAEFADAMMRAPGTNAVEHPSSVEYERDGDDTFPLPWLADEVEFETSDPEHVRLALDRGFVVAGQVRVMEREDRTDLVVRLVKPWTPQENPPTIVEHESADDDETVHEVRDGRGRTVATILTHQSGAVRIGPRGQTFVTVWPSGSVDRLDRSDRA